MDPNEYVHVAYAESFCLGFLRIRQPGDPATFDRLGIPFWFLFAAGTSLHERARIASLQFMAAKMLSEDDYELSGFKESSDFLFREFQLAGLVR